MGYNTKIDWCDASWNPVTGCLHNCLYCYAKGIAERFGGWSTDGEKVTYNPFSVPPALKRPLLVQRKNGSLVKAAFPFGFRPTFHRYRLNEPATWRKPKTIFVCSMADLFGEWVPDEWIKEVFDACRRAPQHRYLFLTKNPNRYIALAEKGLLPTDDNIWFGYSATRQDQFWRFKHADDCPVKNLFVSIEPILEPIKPDFSSHCPADWVIVGAETGNRKGKIIPDESWIKHIAMECAYSGRPIFMKESLRSLMGDDFRQEFPWGVRQ